MQDGGAMPRGLYSTDSVPENTAAKAVAGEAGVPICLFRVGLVQVYVGVGAAIRTCLKSP